MGKFKVGDIVARRSYNYDVLFRITSINGGIADLVGITVRIIADAPEYDLKHISKEEADTIISNLERSRRVRLNRCYSNMNKKYMNIREKKVTDLNPNIFTKEKILKKPGVILHVDRRPRICK
ncbi:MAG: sporulation peptidase YabG [Clostridia bacterium]|nr:sporulation peptidase YabG [Clostridia bacterium]